MASPYKVLERVGNAYRVDLPDLICVHLVFSPNKLCKAPTDLLPGQENDPPPPIQVNRDAEWVVDKVLASKLVRRTLKYQVS
jgi:hypothetical protein